MDYEYLLARRNKALNLFRKVSRKLLALEAEIAGLMSKATSNIIEAEKRIEENVKAHEALNAHLAATKKSREQVSAFLPE